MVLAHNLLIDQTRAQEMTKDPQSELLQIFPNLDRLRPSWVFGQYRNGKILHATISLQLDIALDNRLGPQA